MSEVEVPTEQAPDTNRAPIHGDVKPSGFAVYCSTCNQWVRLDGDDSAKELFEHEGEAHD